MDFFEEDIIEFFRSLNEHQVNYIVVGGFAVNYHGYPRGTRDVDIWLKDNQDNREKFVQALLKLGIEGAELYRELPFIAGYSEVMLDSGVPIDLMCDLQIFKQIDFDECYAIAIDAPLSNTVQVKILHLNSLIREKEQSKRPKDNLDADELKKFYRR